MRSYTRRKLLALSGAGAATLAAAGATAGEAAAAPPFQPRLFEDYVRPADFGVVGNGTTDDGAAFASCLTFAGNNDKTVFIPAGMNIRVTRNLFVFGNASIVGEDRYQSKITLDGDLEALGAGMSAYWVSFGIVGKGGTVRPWTGEVDNVQFVVTAAGSGTGAVLQVIQFHRAEDFAFRNSIIDLRPVGHAARSAMVSQLDGVWCSSPGTFRGKIVDNIMLGASNGTPATGGSGGINLVALDRGLIAGNRIEGFADDAIAVIIAKHCVIRDNWVKGVRSRIAAFGGNDHTFIGNYLERQAGADGNWVASSDFYTSFLASPFFAAPENVKFIGNTAVLPAAATDGGGYHNFLSLGGVRGCVASGNILVGDSNQTNRPRIATYVFTAFPGWVDPTGLDPVGKSRPRSMVLTNNVMTGQYPGRIEEAAVLATDMVGPIVYQGNLASGYNVFGSNSFLEDSNKTV